MVGPYQQRPGQVCARVPGQGAQGKQVMGRAWGPAGHEGVVGGPGRTHAPPPLPVSASACSPSARKPEPVAGL